MTCKIIIICGPTAAGKTEIGIRLAEKFDGEIVSADSCQVWRGFDIGTAKHPSLVARDSWLVKDKPKHHLIDVANPDEHFDAARFIKLADEAIADIAGRGKTPFVVGGTGMYLRMLIHGICGAPPRDKEIRAKIEAEISEKGIWALYDELKAIDPESALRIHPNDRSRVLRALEIYRITGAPASKFRRDHGFVERRYDALKIGLTVGRAELYQRIDERVDRMIANGLVDEVRRLLSRFDAACQPFAAVGYREIVAHIKGELGFDEAVRLTKQNSRRFAKRQLTWFRQDGEITWFDPRDYAAIEAKVKICLS